MNFALITKIAAAIAGLALVATVTIAIVPSSFESTGVWLDQPYPGQQVQQGPVVLTLHATGYVSQFRVVIRKNGKTVKVLNDPSVDTEMLSRTDKFGRLVSGSVQWESAPGTYTIEPRSLAGGSWVKGEKATITVVGPVSGITPSNEPAPTPTDTETPTPTESPTAAPEPTDEPDPVDEPDPTDEPDPVDEQPVMPTGTLQVINKESTGIYNDFYVKGISPEFVDVDVQVRVYYYAPTNAWSGWTSLGCSDLIYEIGGDIGSPTFTCSVKNYQFFGSKSSRDAQARVVITNLDDESLVRTQSSATWPLQQEIG